MLENTNKPVSAKLSVKTLRLAKVLKEQFSLHSIEETVYLALKLLFFLRKKDGLSKGQLWQIAGYSTKEFEIQVHVKGKVGKPVTEEIKPIPIKIKEVAKDAE